MPENADYAALRNECEVALSIPFDKRSITHGDAFYEAVLAVLPARPRWRMGQASSAEYFGDRYCLACDGLVSNPFDDELACPRCGWTEPCKPACSTCGRRAGLRPYIDCPNDYHVVVRTDDGFEPAGWHPPTAASSTAAVASNPTSRETPPPLVSPPEGSEQ